MQHLIAKIGKGPKGSKDLTWAEAKEAMRHLLEDEVTCGQVGAFLMAMRIKMETISELAAFTATARHMVQPLKASETTHLVDLPLYGEKHSTYHAIIVSAIVASAAGASILLHSVECPAATSDVPRILGQLGIPLSLDANQLQNELAHHQFGYVDLGWYHPPLARLLDLRQEFGVQNLAHQVARMINPARAPGQVIGVAHPPYLDKMIEALDMLHTARALILQGVEGYPELSISTTTPVRELRHGRIIPLTIRPPDVGLPFGSYQAMALPLVGSDTLKLEQEAALLLRILRNQVRGHHRAWVIFNAALLLYTAGTASSLAQGGKIAQQILENGTAWNKFQELTTCSFAPQSFKQEPLHV